MCSYEHAAAKSEIEAFLWTELADNYLEMAKLRLYDQASVTHAGAQFAISHLLLTVLKLFAPFLPHVTEEIYGALYATDADPSIHTTTWPAADHRLEDGLAERAGEAIVAVATAVRRYKSEHNLPLGQELGTIYLAPREAEFASSLREAEADLLSITRASQICVEQTQRHRGVTILATDPVWVALDV
jgi:valyl-tRNA synthetase